MSDLNAIIDLHQVTNPSFSRMEDDVGSRKKYPFFAQSGPLILYYTVKVVDGGANGREDKLIIKEVVSNVSFKPLPPLELISLKDDDIGGLIFIFLPSFASFSLEEI